jgi:hypothetical protein
MKGMAAPYYRTSLHCNRDASNGPTGVMDDGAEPNQLTYEVSRAPRQSISAFRPGCQRRRPVSLRSSQNSVLPDREFLDEDRVRFRRFSLFSPEFLDDEPEVRALTFHFLPRCLRSSSSDRSRRNVVSDLRVGSLNDQHRIRRREDALIAMEARLMLVRRTWS